MLSGQNSKLAIVWSSYLVGIYISIFPSKSYLFRFSLEFFIISIFVWIFHYFDVCLNFSLLLFYVLFFPRETWEKVDLSFLPNGTVTFNQRKVFRFDPDQSAGSEDDVVIVPNIPMLVSSTVTYSRSDGVCQFNYYTCANMMSQCAQKNPPQDDQTSEKDTRFNRDKFAKYPQKTVKDQRRTAKNPWR